ncbi:MAG: hypothetical protein ACQKBY_07650 [Verrucomicrobiales bacterium]
MEPTSHPTPYAPPAQRVAPPSAFLGEKKLRLKSIDAIKAGIVSAALYALFSLIFVLIFLPFGLLGAFSGSSAGAEIFGMGLGMMIALPLMYGVFGFIGGVIAALIYNLVAKMTGGLELTFVEAV